MVLTLRKCCPKEQILDEWNQCVKAPPDLDLQKRICQNKSCYIGNVTYEFNCPQREQRMEHILDDKIPYNLKNQGCIDMGFLGTSLEGPMLIMCSLPQHGILIY